MSKWALSVSFSEWQVIDVQGMQISDVAGEKRLFGVTLQSHTGACFLALVSKPKANTNQVRRTERRGHRLDSTLAPSSFSKALARETPFSGLFPPVK